MTRDVALVRPRKAEVVVLEMRWRSEPERMSPRTKAQSASMEVADEMALKGSSSSLNVRACPRDPVRNRGVKVGEIPGRATRFSAY